MPLRVLESSFTRQLAAAQPSPTSTGRGIVYAMTTQDAHEKIRVGYTFDEPAIDLGVLSDADGNPLTDARVRIPLGMLNRHGLISGATGTGKTITLQVLAEQISAAGVPVFAADIKGDLSGVASPGEANEKLLARTAKNGQDWQPKAAPTEFFTLGDQGTGIPLRATVSAFGPILMSKVLGLNATQESSLGLVFHYADSQGLPLLDLIDLSTLLKYLTSDEGKAELKEIGGLSSQTAGVILREIVNLEAQGGGVFFGEPEFDTNDFLRVTADGKGVVNVLELPNLQDRPALFSTFLMWLLADMYSGLPEVGDTDKPKLVFFFDEAHLLFNDASKDFLQQVTQTVRLIRSKGVGVFFVTQTPKDVPADVLAQLGSRVQHQLRAHTPNDEKALRATVNTFPKSDYDLAELLTQLGVGQAVVTVMDPDGSPTPVAWTRIFAPQSKMGPTDPARMSEMVGTSYLAPKYSTPIDRDSAYEMLTRKLEAGAAAAAEEAAAKAAEEARAAEAKAQAAADEKAAKEAERARIAAEKEAERARLAAEKQRAKRDAKIDHMIDSGMRQLGRSVAREVSRSIFGTGRRR